MDLAVRKDPDNDPSSVTSGRDDANTSFVQGQGLDQFRDCSPQSFAHNDKQTDFSNWNNRAVPENEFCQTYELSREGRKRRKISLEPDGDSGLLHLSTAEQDRSLESNAQTVLAQSSDKVLVERNSAHESQNEHLDNLPKQSSTRRRGRPPKSAAIAETKMSNTLSADRGEDDGRSSPKSEQERTPKVTMKISANGKLYESTRSPRSRSPLVPIKSSAPEKSSRSTAVGKNIGIKNGKLTQRLVVILKYDPLSKEGVSTRSKIESIFAGSMRVPVVYRDLSSTAHQASSHSKGTHPFFLAKVTQQQNPSAENSPGLAGEAFAEVKKPVAWEDLVFKSKRSKHSNTQRDGSSEKPFWPPLAYQHVGAAPRPSLSWEQRSFGRCKQKARLQIGNIAESESILSPYVSKISSSQNNYLYGLKLPQRLQCTAVDELLEILPYKQLLHDTRAVQVMRSKAVEGNSPFDRAEAPGPYQWAQQYSPSTWQEILQHSCQTLYEWLSGLAVHNVKQGLEPNPPRQPLKRRKRPKKQYEDLENFIDFEEESLEKPRIKNAILIVGPHGCGKTASVYTIAKQLGFEVFEIHAGMRRSQKDIFDKVGDMTQNHMVQGRQSLSRDSSILHDANPPSSEEEAAQAPVASFFGPPGIKKALDNSRSTTPQPTKHEQKQSLILFEEVDHVFEEDRGFWSGVQALIQSSKRPVVLTCNDPRDIPLDELDLHTILSYTAPATDAIAEYLCYMAAAEGHVIDPDAIKTLYETKGHDLRATITELDFWCQMTVGSKQGGLDWFPSFTPKAKMESRKTIRTFSRDTFRTGLDLLPAISHAPEADLEFFSDHLGIPCDALLEEVLENTGTDANFHVVTNMMDLLQDRSDIDLMHTTSQPFLYNLLATLNGPKSREIDGPQTTKLKIKYDSRMDTDKVVSFECLDALGAETSIYSLGSGRLTPSLDGPRSALACDVAPYIRSIATYDNQLEQQREEMFPSQGKKRRNTRAARAAAEGGDKASTRRERWFPQNLDLGAVLDTGNGWPQWPSIDVEYMAIDADSIVPEP